MNEIDAYAADRRRAYRAARQKARRARLRRQRLTAAVVIAIAILLIAAEIPANEGSHAEAPVEAAHGYILKTTSAAELHTQTIINPTVVADKPSETPAAAAEYEPDAAEVEALARMLYGEARGIASDMEKAACV